jgi:hypothetical protein
MPRKQPGSKYKNTKTTVDGITFDSAKEARRYQELTLLQKCGQISNLVRQKVFTLAPAVILGGRVKPSLRYICDFSYWQDGQEVVEDVKSDVTKKLPAYRIKKHLMRHLYGIEITET